MCQSKLKTSATRFLHLLTVGGFSVCLLAACSEAPPESPAQAAEPQLTEPTAAVARIAPASDAPTFDELATATYQGLLELPAITLTDGVWEGSPYEEGGAARPKVVLAREFLAIGDITGNGRHEALVILDVTTGGTGEFIYLAVMAYAEGGELSNIASEFIGDRVQILDAHIDHDQIRMTLVQAGADDAACCPGEIAQLAWQWLPDEGLTALSIEAMSERLTPETLGSLEWVLRQWATDEPAPPAPAITLSFADGRLAGTGGCNRYFTSVTSGSQPGEISLGPIGSTMMACPEPIMDIEQRFLAQLSKVGRFGFLHTRLALNYRNEAGESNLMLFEARSVEPIN